MFCLSPRELRKSILANALPTSVGRTNGTSLSDLKPDSEKIGKAGRHPSCPF
jgi:hypothetical protein